MLTGAQSIHPDRSRGRLQESVEELQKRAFAGAVVPEDQQTGSWRRGQIDGVQRACRASGVRERYAGDLEDHVIPASRRSRRTSGSPAGARSRRRRAVVHGSVGSMSQYSDPLRIRSAGDPVKRTPPASNTQTVSAHRTARSSVVSVNMMVDRCARRRNRDASAIADAGSRALAGSSSRSTDGPVAIALASATF